MFDVFLSLQFEQENQRLIGEMNSLFDEVRYVCRSCQLVASLQLQNPGPLPLPVGVLVLPPRQLHQLPLLFPQVPSCPSAGLGGALRVAHCLSPLAPVTACAGTVLPPVPWPPSPSLLPLARGRRHPIQCSHTGQRGFPSHREWPSKHTLP